MDFDYCHHMMTTLTLREEAPAHDGVDDTNRPISHKELLAASLLHGSGSSAQPRPLLAIRDSTARRNRLVGAEPHHSLHFSSFVTPPASRLKTIPSNPRYIPSSPSCILDAPDLRDDFYLNLMDWGPNNIVAIALGMTVYLYNAHTSQVQDIPACTHPRDYVASVAWVKNTSSCGDGAYRLAVGTYLGELQIWDIEALTMVRSIQSHRGRISSLSWSCQVAGHGTLATGSRDAKVHLSDIRVARHLVGTLAHHQQEVCGLAWSPDGTTLASGSNDNNLCIWDHAMVRSNDSNTLSAPRLTLVHHSAAVRALAWSPSDRHILASGGGTTDGTIKLWNASTARLLRSVPTGSQVCSLVWSSTTQELVSAHGQLSASNQLTLWTYPSMKPLRDLTWHTSRALHLAISPNGTSVASAGADETLCFWNVFPSVALSDGRLNMPTAVIR
ncbi:hypothetical protein PR003_g17179 [Phytophthora rubi]|nr:hypothetical protein PR003_g17179 [Phytophthora rubi]